jgi:hypothetical protein
MKKRTTLFISSAVVIFAISVSFAYYHSFVVPKKIIAEKCGNYVPNWNNFIDCYGVIVINDAWDVDYLSVRDHIHEYEIARVYNQDEYIHINEKIFIINMSTIEGQVSDGEKIQYSQELFQGGRLVTNYYDSISDIPTYLIVNIQSGEVRAYKNLEDVPPEEQTIFEQLKINNK